MLVGLEGIAGHFAEDGGLAAVSLFEGHADVTDGRGGRVLTVVDHVAIHEGVDAVSEGSREAHGSVSRDGTDHCRREHIGAEVHLLGGQLVVGDCRADIVAALIIRIFEAVGVDRGAHPLFAVGVGRDGLLAAADLVLGLGSGMLHPLIILGTAHEADSVHGHAVIGVGQDLVGLGHGDGVDQFALEGRIHGRDAGDIDALGLSRLEHSGGFDSTTLVPPQEDGRGDKQDETGDNPLKGVAQTAAIACLGYFLVGHTLILIKG